MNKSLYAILLAPLLMIFSCTDSRMEEKDPIDNVSEKGMIILKSNFDSDVDEKAGTRAVSQNDLFIILEGPENRTLPYPESGIIEELSAGNYTVTVTTHPEEYVPGFDSPRYEGSDTVEVRPLKSSSASITCTQVNAGIYFEYDSSLAEYGIENIVPVVSQDSHSLSFSGDYRAATGYFEPGELEVSFTLAGLPITINGNSSKKVSVGAKEVCRFLVKCEQTRSTYDTGMTVQLVSIR